MQPDTQRLPRTSRLAPSRPARKAFSLIELMVVIVIIAILMALILSGVRGAMGTVRNATVTVEFKNLEKGILDFKTKYGIEPPSRILLCEDGADWTTLSGTLPTGFTAADIPRSRALIRQMWPDFSFAVTNDNDINGDGDMTDLLGLSGAECLVFFLGGVPVQTGVTETPWSLQGFSANPLNPWALGGARSGPFYQFDAARLKNYESRSGTDAEFMPEYVDALPGQLNPILYASSYGGKGYRDSDVQLTVQNPYDAYATLPTGFAYYYRRYSGTYPVPAVDPPGPPVLQIFSSLEAFNPKTFQLISPGADTEYGWGGALNVGMELVEPRPERSFERDNITNFKGGVLN